MISRRLRSAVRLGVPATALLAAALILVPTAPGPRATEGEREWVEVSAPILPKVLVLYAAEGANFPATAEAQATLAHQAALTYDVLLRECPAKYPEIVIPKPGDPPTTPAQNAANLEAIATCSYQEYTAKPYWVPALIDLVDICGRELGTGWHLPTEEEVTGFDDSDRNAIRNALTTPNASGFFGNFYFSSAVWVRGKDGGLKQGDLSPGTQTPVSDLPVSASSRSHYEGGLALRCIRRSHVVPPRAGG